jgi:hypothetical protein
MRLKDSYFNQWKHQSKPYASEGFLHMLQLIRFEGAARLPVEWI